MARISHKPKSAAYERFLFCIFAFLLSFAAGPAVAAPDEGKAFQTVASSTLASHFQPGSIQSAERANLALSETERERAEIAARFAADERACLEQFFANSCVADAQERQRHALAEVRKVEVEANALLRRLRAEERDRALAEKRAEQERKEAERLKESAPLSPSSAAPAGASRQESTTVAPAADVSDRQARHEAKLKQIEERERADAQKRADNVATYEKKVMQAEQRQRTAGAKALKEEKK